MQTNYLSARLILAILMLIFSGSAVFGQSFSDAESGKYETAAKRNAELQYSLKWTLGRRPQKGWYLYVPLLKHTLKTEADPFGAEFAYYVAKWQKDHRIYSNGILDSKTLYSFIKFWQSKRLRPIVLAQEDELLTAPIADFFDPTRDIALLKVEKETYRAYKKMLAAAIADKSLGLKLDERGNLAEDEKFLKLVSTYRSPAYQASLRKKQPGASRAQIAFKSPHFTGRALDLYVGGEPVTTKDFNRAVQIRTPVYKWLIKNAEKFGFVNYFYEPWHWEYVLEK